MQTCLVIILSLWIIPLQGFSLFGKSKQSRLNEDLRQAAYTGRIEKIVSLLNKGAQIDATPTGNTALTIAASKGYTQILLTLLKSNTLLLNPTIVDTATHKHVNTPLAWAAYRGDTPMIIMLLRKNADVNKSCEGGVTPLMCAVYKGQIEAVETLLAADASLSLQCEIGNFRRDTALSIARKQGYTEIAERLNLEKVRRARWSIDRAAWCNTVARVAKEPK